jgi:hypothetical protein
MKSARGDKTVSKHNSQKKQGNNGRYRGSILRSSVPSPLRQQSGRLREERGGSRKSVSDEYATLYIRAHVLKHRFSFANHTVFRHLLASFFAVFFLHEKICCAIRQNTCSFAMAFTL